jgi:flagellar biogenesis protein FliO
MEFSTQQQVSNPEVQERTEGLKKSLLKEEATPVVAEGEPAAEPAVSKEEADSPFQNAFTTFIVMMSLLGLVWFWSKKKGSADASAENSRDMGEHILGHGAQLKFVEVNNEVWVLGLTAGSLNLLHRVAKSEWTETNVDELPEMKADSADFKSLYKMFRN